MTEHTTIPKVSRLEVIQTGARRRWTLDENGGSSPRAIAARGRSRRLRGVWLVDRSVVHLAAAGTKEQDVDPGALTRLIGALERR